MVLSSTIRCEFLKHHTCGRDSPRNSGRKLTAVQTGQRPDGRILAPIMPWRAFAQLTRADATAIAEYLKSLPAVNNRVPGPFGPTEQPASFVMEVVAPEVVAK
jgi:hypothetical protein